MSKKSKSISGSTKFLPEVYKKHILPIDIDLFINGEAEADDYEFEPKMSIKNATSSTRLYIPHSTAITKLDIMKGSIYNKPSLEQSDIDKVSDGEMLKVFTEPKQIMRAIDFANLKSKDSDYFIIKNNKKDDKKDGGTDGEKDDEKDDEKDKNIKKRKRKALKKNIELLVKLLFSKDRKGKYKQIVLDNETYSVFKKKTIPYVGKYEPAEDKPNKKSVDKENKSEKEIFSKKFSEGKDDTYDREDDNKSIVDTSDETDNNQEIFWKKLKSSKNGYEYYLIKVKIYVSKGDQPSLVKQQKLMCVGRRQRLRKAMFKFFGKQLDFMGEPGDTSIIPKQLISKKAIEKELKKEKYKKNEKRYKEYDKYDNPYSRLPPIYRDNRQSSNNAISELQDKLMGGRHTSHTRKFSSKYYKNKPRKTTKKYGSRKKRSYGNKSRSYRMRINKHRLTKRKYE